MLEVCSSNADDDNGEGQLGAAHNLIDGLIRVRDHSICQHQKYIVLLVVLRDFLTLDFGVDGVDNLREIGRTVERADRKRFSVRHLDTLDAVAFRIETVAVERELMPSCRVSSNVATEAVRRDRLVVIVILQNVADTSQSLQVLIVLRV